MKKYDVIIIGAGPAGFGEYWTGEGIYYAVKSGTIAADVIYSSIKSGVFDFQSLQKRYQREIIRGLRFAYHTGKFFYGHLPRSFTLGMSYFANIMYESASLGHTFDQTFLKFHTILLNLMLKKSHISNKRYYK
jgi:flavin-dependent dehydrogenase